MVTIYIPTRGQVSVFLERITSIGSNFLLHGKDAHNNHIHIVADRFAFADDYISQYGYIHIIKYTIYNHTVPCDVLSSMA